MDYNGKNRGVVLHTIKHGENGIIAYLYTENNGRMSYFMRSNKLGRVTIGKNSLVLQPLTVVDFVAMSRSDGSVIKWKEAKRSFMTANIVFDIRKSTIALFISEFIYKIVRENHPNPLLFDFIYHSIKVLDAIEKGVANFHIYFVVKLCQYTGFAPGVNYQQEAFFDIHLGKYTITRPQHANYFSQQSAYFLNLFQNSTVDSLADIKMDRIQRLELLNSMVQYYEYHNEVKYKIESLNILSEIF